MIEYHQIRQTKKYRKKSEDNYGIQDNGPFPVHIISPCPYFRIQEVNRFASPPALYFLLFIFLF